MASKRNRRERQLQSSFLDFANKSDTSNSSDEIPCALVRRSSGVQGHQQVFRPSTPHDSEVVKFCFRFY